jgi:cyclase
MANYPYTKGLHDLGNGAWAYLQPDGSWGWSNAGLIVDGEETLLVDTLFDFKTTAEMLSKMRAAVPKAEAIDTLVNTHSNGDHTYGNKLAGAGEIISSQICAEEMAERGPEKLAELMRNAGNLGEGGRFLYEAMGPGKFDFEEIDEYALPTRTFEDELTLTVGGKEVRLINVGPAHTGGDVLVHVPGDRTVFTGDILFNEGHPVIWEGPISNWVRACDMMLEWDLETVVPGHGAICGKEGIQRMKDYLLYIEVEARKRYEAGMEIEEAALDISMADFDGWFDAERIVINLQTLYGEFAGDRPNFDRIKLFGMMARYAKAR